VSGEAVDIRVATVADDAALAAIDRATSSWLSSPAPVPPDGETFFDGRADPEDVLVAESGGAVVGYVQIGPSIPVLSNAHVMTVRGLAVEPGRRGEGIGRRLVEAAVAAARGRGARRLTLRVLGPNAAARAVYEACGFVVEGVLREEFLLDGRYVDDVLMAVDLVRGSVASRSGAAG
jgi:ribosomal protein S18 acetylase RimI-like enzyme